MIGNGKWSEKNKRFRRNGYKEKQWFLWLLFSYIRKHGPITRVSAYYYYFEKKIFGIWVHILTARSLKCINILGQSNRISVFDFFVLMLYLFNFDGSSVLHGIHQLAHERIPLQTPGTSVRNSWKRFSTQNQGDQVLCHKYCYRNVTFKKCCTVS